MTINLNLLVVILFGIIYSGGFFGAWIWFYKAHRARPLLGFDLQDFFAYLFVALTWPISGIAYAILRLAERWLNK